MTSNKPNRRIIVTGAIKVLFLMFTLVIVFLFALNGRYAKVSDDEYFDKWTKTIVAIDRYEIIK